MGTRDEMRDGMHRTAIREIKLQQEIEHLNCVRLLDVIASVHSVSMVMPFMDTDMERLIR
jgi:cyclin-dependent kinase 7